MHPGFGDTKLYGGEFIFKMKKYVAVLPEIQQIPFDWPPSVFSTKIPMTNSSSSLGIHV